jgi:hypothetical protein
MSLPGIATILTLSLAPSASADVSQPGPGSILITDPSLAPLWSALEAEEHPDRLWYTGWATFFGTVAVGRPSSRLPPAAKAAASLRT